MSQSPEKDELVERLEEMDPSDDYHTVDGELDAKSYYAAIDRAIALVEGTIVDWMSARVIPPEATDA